VLYYNGTSVGTPMPFYRFIWNDVAQIKVEEHGVTLDEFENIVSHPMEVEASRSTGRPIAFGFGDDGRMIACVYEPVNELEVVPITAYEIED
jgi:uncharacterized DUF497 family protein